MKPTLQLTEKNKPVLQVTPIKKPVFQGTTKKVLNPTFINPSQMAKNNALNKAKLS